MRLRDLAIAFVVWLVLIAVAVWRGHGDDCPAGGCVFCQGGMCIYGDTP